MAPQWPECTARTPAQEHTHSGRSGTACLGLQAHPDSLQSLTEERAETPGGHIRDHGFWYRWPVAASHEGILLYHVPWQCSR
jgi:hypothetical protein